jgi:two-component system OmpR family sensor kinase
MWALASQVPYQDFAYVIDTVPCEGGADCDFRVKASWGRDGHFFVIGKSLADVDRTFNQIVLAEVLTASAVLVALAVVAYWVLRQGVRPLDEIAEAADAISAGDLSRRVSHPAPNTEAGRVGLAFNRMLSQIEEDIRQREESEQRLKRFVADASHELRTPLTSVRGYAELWRQGGLRSDEALADAMTRIERESARMGRLVEDLLLLTRLDEGIPLQHVPVDLSQIAQDVVADARVVDADRWVTVDAPEPVLVLGDDDRLRQVVGNLVTNARTHTAPETPVHVYVRTEGDNALVMVRDEGPGMDAETASHVFGASTAPTCRAAGPGRRRARSVDRGGGGQRARRIRGCRHGSGQARPCDQAPPVGCDHRDRVRIPGRGERSALDLSAQEQSSGPRIDGVTAVVLLVGVHHHREVVGGIHARRPLAERWP